MGKDRNLLSIKHICILYLVILSYLFLFMDKAVAAEWTEPLTGMEFVLLTGDCFKMGFIQAGCYLMGSDKIYDAKPVHLVSVPSFEIGKYEVTVSQWRAVMGKNHRRADERNCDNCPVGSLVCGVRPGDTLYFGCPGESLCHCRGA